MAVGVGAGGNDILTLGTSEGDIAAPSGEAWDALVVVFWNSHTADVTIKIYSDPTGADASTQIDEMVIGTKGKYIFTGVPQLANGDKLRGLASVDAVVRVNVCRRADVT